MKEICTGVIDEYRRLWLARNKAGGLNRSLVALLKVQKEIDNRLRVTNSNALVRTFHRITGKIKAAAGAIFIRLA